MIPLRTRIFRALVSLAVAAFGVVILISLLPAGAYLWVKALHVISVIAWMAGMLYLPRLMVYHCDAEKGSRQSETFKVMERRLLNLIINPAMVATWAFGGVLAWQGNWLGDGWLHAKLALVILMSALHGMMVGWVRAFGEDRNQHTARFYRVVNEVPTALLVLIVILVIVKPF